MNTSAKDIKTLKQDMFQSLIETMNTKREIEKILKEEVVSIPHRNDEYQ